MDATKINEIIDSVILIKSATLLQLKGILSDSNTIFHMRMNQILRSEDINKIKLICKISVDSNLTFSSYAWLYKCVPLLPKTTVLNKVSCTRLFCENCSHFILKWFQPNSFGEVCFFRGEIQKYAKNSNFDNFESALYSKSVSMPLSFQVVSQVTVKVSIYCFFENSRLNNFNPWKFHTQP